MTTEQGRVPPIRDWWPHVSIDARHALLETKTLDHGVRAEIAKTTGAPVAEDAALSEEDLHYIGTQSEQVD